jgi:hypothetical protein
MIKNYVFLLLLLPLGLKAQDKFELLDKSSMETTILYNRAYKIADITNTSKKVNAIYFIQALSELKKADYNQNFESIDSFKNASKIGFSNHYVPLAILNTKFDILSEAAFDNGLITLDENQNIIKSSPNIIQPLFETFERTIGSPLTQKVRGLHVTYKVLPEYIINTTEQQINSIKVDFNDNNGFRNINFNESIDVQYITEGEKLITFEITLNDGTIRTNSAYIFVELSSSDLNALAPGDEGPITAINATIPYQGFGESIAHIGTAEYKIYYDNVDGVLDKPIFFIDGFDPNDTRTIPLMYSLLNYGNPVENLADIVRDEGFDLVVLNFPTYTSSSDGTTVINGGADFIQRNAYILVELINTINSMKVGNEENVVIGPSMGGLISRYALRYMEQNAMDHETRLYLSFDSPHLGANVPIGIQYLFNYMVNGDPGITAAEPLVSGLLNSAAAKQMLIDHFSAHLSGVDEYTQNPSITLPIGAANFRNAFQSEIDAMGFPQSTRNVSIVNGSGLGATTGSPGMSLLSHTFNTGVVGGFNTQAIINTNFTPVASQTNTVTDFVGQAFIFVWIEVFSYLATAASPSFTDGLDSAPGGQFDLYSFDDGTNPLITEFVANLNSQYFDFIPTLSALAITETNNWYDLPNVTNGRSASSTLYNSPFINTYIPDANEPHVTLTDANVAFALTEILNPPLSIYNPDNISTIKLEQNPITNDIVILSNTSYNDANITVTDLTGKIVLNTKTNLSERTIIPLNISSGLYVLNINSANNFNYQTKLLVK